MFIYLSHSVLGWQIANINTKNTSIILKDALWVRAKDISYDPFTQLMLCNQTQSQLLMIQAATVCQKYTKGSKI